MQQQEKIMDVVKNGNGKTLLNLIIHHPTYDRDDYVEYILDQNEKLRWNIDFVKEEINKSVILLDEDY